MKLLVFSDHKNPLAQACVEGLSLLGNTALWRNPHYVKASEIERCDMVLAFDGQNAHQVRDIHAAAEIPVICCGSGMLPSAELSSITLDTWGGIVPVKCKPDRAESMALADWLGVDGDGENKKLYVGGEPLAEIGDDVSVESISARLAYSHWTLAEISTGAPFAFIYDVMVGNPQVEEVVKESLTTEYEDEVEGEEMGLAHGGVVPAPEPRLVGEIPCETTVSITPPQTSSRQKRRGRR